MDDLNTAQRVAIWILPVLFAITVHEVAHGWTAKRLGDPTAMMLGRLTLNPIKHIDPFGTILVPGLMLLAPTSFIFGWAKPVPVTWQNLKNPKRDLALVALGGPMANLAMAVAWAMVSRLGVLLHQGFPWLAEPLIFMGVAGMFINSILFVLNLVPLPPLDGGRVLAGVLPPRMAAKVSLIEPYGLIILLLLLFSGALGRVLGPLISLLQSVFSYLTGIPAAMSQAILLSLMGV